MVGSVPLTYQLTTPGSEYAIGGSGIGIDLLFARAGSDVLVGYDPATNDRRSLNIDLLFGDLFDNSGDEFSLINRLASGDFFAILDAPVPSVGSDRFVLGDQFATYYTAPDPLSLLTTDFLGLNQFAVVYDFVPGADTIQLNGSRDDYHILEVDDLQVTGFGAFSGELLFSVKQGIPDLVSIIVSRPEVDLDLDDASFIFVGDQPDTKPVSSKILQLGTPGADLGSDVAIGPDGGVVVVGTTQGSLFGPNAAGDDAFVAKFDARGRQTTAFQIGADAEAGTSGQKVVTDAAGNFYVAGSTGSDLFGNPGEPVGSYVAKYDPAGNLIWGRKVAIPDAFATNAFGLDVDASGSVYLSGLAQKVNQNRDVFNFPVEDDPFLIKFDRDGNREWTTELDTLFFAENYDLAVDAQGNSYLVGWTQGLVDAGAFGGVGNPLLPQTPSDPSRDLLKYDAWIAKVDPSGQFAWVKQFGSADEGLEFGWGVDTDSRGDIYVTGWTTGSLGDTDEFPKAEGRDVFLAKFEPVAGELQFVKQIGSRADDGGFTSDVTIDERDNVFVTGYTNGKLGGGRADSSFDAWVGRFDTDGNNVWLNRIGDRNAYDSAAGLDARDGKVVVTGATDGLLGETAWGTAGGSFDAWVAQLDVDNGRLETFKGRGGREAASFVDEPLQLPITDVTDRFVVDSMPLTGDRVMPAGAPALDRALGALDAEAALDGLLEANAGSSLITALQDALKNDAGVLGQSMAPVDGGVAQGRKGDGTIIGTLGADDLQGRRGADDLYALSGDDRLSSDNGNDRLFGGTGDDWLSGGRGEDLLVGADSVLGRGFDERDEAVGGTGADTFVFGDEVGAFYLGAGSSDYLLVRDVRAEEGDVLLLSGSASDYRLAYDVEGPDGGTAIYDAATDDLIGIVRNQTLGTLTSSLFDYV